MNGLMAVLLVVFMAGVSIAGDYFLKLAGNGTKFIDFKPFFIGGIIFALSTIGFYDFSINAIIYLWTYQFAIGIRRGF